MSMLSLFSRLFGSSRPDAPSPQQFVHERDLAAPVLDVRTPAEFASGHVKGAINVDVMAPDFATRVEALLTRGTLQKDGTVYLYCRSGNRSGRRRRCSAAWGSRSRRTWAASARSAPPVPRWSSAAQALNTDSNSRSGIPPSSGPTPP